MAGGPVRLGDGDQSAAQGRRRGARLAAGGEVEGDGIRCGRQGGQPESPAPELEGGEVALVGAQGGLALGIADGLGGPLAERIQLTGGALGGGQVAGVQPVAERARARPRRRGRPLQTVGTAGGRVRGRWALMHDKFILSCI